MAIDAQFQVGLIASLGLDQGSITKAQKTLSTQLGKPLDLGKGFADKMRSAFSGNALRPATAGLNTVGLAAHQGAQHAHRLRDTLDHIKRRVSETWHMGGLGRAAEQLGEIRRGAVEAREGLEKFMKPFGLGGLAATGSIAGFGEALRGFAERGAETGRTAAAFGVSTDVLQRWRGAARLSGLSEQDATGALSQLAQTSHLVKYGLPGSAEAVGAASYIDPSGALLASVKSGDVEKAMRILADKIQGQEPMVQHQMLQAFGLDSLFELLRKGSGEVDKFLAEAEKLRHLNEGQVKTAEELEKALRGATDATGGFADALGSRFAPEAKAALGIYTDLLNKLKETPAAMKAAEIGSVWMIPGIGPLLGIAKLLSGGSAQAAPLAKLPTQGALDQHGLTGGLAPAAYEAISRAEGTFGAGGINYNKVFGGELAGLTDMSLSDVQAHQSRMTGSTAVGAFQVLKGTLGDAIQGLKLDPRTTKFSPEVQRRIADWVKEKQGFGAWEGFKTHPDELRRALGAANKFSGGAVDLGRIKPELVESLSAAALRMPDGVRAVATSGARSGGLAGSQHHIDGRGFADALDLQLFGPDGRPIANRGADATGMYGTLARLFYEETLHRHPELAGRAAWGGNFETKPGSGVPDLMHYDYGGDRGKFGRLGDEYELATAGDTKHHVEVHFIGAPPGMRTGLTRSEGPATLQLRTSLAMQNPS